MAKTLRQATRVGFTTKNSPLSNSEVDNNFIEMVEDILAERDAVATLTNKTINNPTITGQTLFAQGSSSVPSISFVNDGSPDTGLYHISAGVFGVTCNTLPVVRFKATGAELLGAPTAQTAAVGANTSQIATTAHVFAERTAIATLTNKTLTGAALNGTLGATTRSTVAATTINATGTIVGLNLSGINTGDQSSVSGNAGTATTLATARTIGGVSFNGSANINLPGVNIAGNQSTTGNASTATNVAYSGLTGTVPTWNQSTSGNAGSVTNGVYRTGNQTIGGNKFFTDRLFATKNGLAVGSADSPQGFEIGNGSDTGAAVMTFHRSTYAINMGLDTDNVFRLGGWSQGANIFRFTSDTGGNFVALGNIGAFSDIRLKTDITKITDALAKVNQLNGYTYTRIDTGERQTGVIAQELQKVLPEAVVDDGETLSVAYGNIMGLMIEAVKELTARIKVLEAR